MDAASEDDAVGIGRSTASTATFLTPASPDTRTTGQKDSEAINRLRRATLERPVTRVRSTYRAALEDFERARNANVCERIVHSPLFDCVIAFLILANTVLVGVEQSYDLQDRYPNEMFVVESTFLVVYLLELVLRFRAFGFLNCLKDNWVKMDILLVVTGMTFTWILTPSVVKGLSPSGANVSVLRTARALRLARMLRLVIKFRSLWMLMQGLLNSANMMISVLIVLSIIVYVFACIGVDLVGGHRLLSNPDADGEFVEMAEAHFANLFSAMLTILSFLVFDSVRQIYWPLVSQDPTLLVYFLAVIFTVGIVLANLVTAVMVNGAIEQASHNREAKLLADKAMRKDVLRETMEIFRSMDTDGSGVISHQEVAQITEKNADLLQSLIHVRDPVELLDALDVDDSGAVELDEFLKVVEQVACHPGESIRFLKLEKVLNQMRTAFSSQYEKLEKSIGVLSEQVDQLGNEARTAAAPSGSYAVSAGVPQSVGGHSHGHAKSGFEVYPKFHSGVSIKNLPGATPMWASRVYENLTKELERSTNKILSVLHDEQEFCGALQEAKDSGTTLSRDYRTMHSSANALMKQAEQKRDHHRATVAMRSCGASEAAALQSLDGDAHGRERGGGGSNSGADEHPAEDHRCEAEGCLERVLPEPTPVWASFVHRNLLQELESSTSKILGALRRNDDVQGLHVQEGQADGESFSLPRLLDGQEAKDKVSATHMRVTSRTSLPL
eukprot:TRINITY_DN10301_c0_g5_i1.p1 TRINITY_DN10301_c0_g5~~TRINITY_DN10301_c0_g5_i1.p1  ORF type:complete len:728 (+),score=104.32 TRINITY_DN10301_c0_g5_i1:95-2278(+)